MTCYYYRKAYYRSFWLSPPACAVAEPHRRYHGESRVSRLGQNLHRYFFYAAVLISVINTYDALHAFVTADGSFGLGLGNLILLANVVLLWAYTVSCHSCRSIIGGRLNNFSRHPVRYKAVAVRLPAQRQAHGAGVDDIGDAGHHRLLHHGRLGRMDLRPRIVG